MQKPTFCDQNWLDMQPTHGGRICGECTKTIIDFRKHSWAEIQAQQAAANNSICGIYTNKQLKHWGKEVPRKTQDCKRAAAMLATMATLLTATPLVAQNSEVNPIERVEENKSTIIKGTMTDERGEPLLIANVAILQNGSICTGTSTDFDGNYEIDISDCMNSNQKIEVEFSYIGFEDVKMNIEDLKENTAGVIEERNVINYDVVLPQGEIIAFYVRDPDYKAKFGWRVKRFFRKVKNVFKRQ